VTAEGDAAPQGDANSTTEGQAAALGEGGEPVGEAGGERERGRRRGRGGRDRNREGRDDGAPRAAEGGEGETTAVAPLAVATFDDGAAPAEMAPAMALADIEPMTQVESAPAAVAQVMPAPVAVPAVVPVAAPVVAAPAAAPAAAIRALPYALPTDALHSIAQTAGLEWVNSDAEKIRAVQAAMAAEPQPIRVPREPKRHLLEDVGPLVLVETRRDLSQVKLPFEHGAGS
jgi:ribonuclease E